jgi:hypothetical protein
VTASNKTIRRTLFDALDLPSLHRYQYPPESVQVPAAIIAGLDISPAATGGKRETTATVLIVVSHSDVDQLETLDMLLDEDDDGSVLHAIEATTNEDGVSLSWQDAGSYGEVQWNGVSYYGAVVTVKAWT